MCVDCERAAKKQKRYKFKVGDRVRYIGGDNRGFVDSGLVNDVHVITSRAEGYDYALGCEAWFCEESLELAKS